MAKPNRELVRAARAYQTFHGDDGKPIKYTVARVEVLRIAQESDYTFDELAEFFSDTGNRTMCEQCGWTYNMVCPECAKGCGCNNGLCSGWCHAEYAGDDFDDEPDEWECECGAGHEYHCVCGGTPAGETEVEPDPDDYYDRTAREDYEPEPPEDYYDAPDEPETGHGDDR